MQDQFHDEKASKKSDARRRMPKEKDEYYEEVGDLGDQMRALGSGGGDIEQHQKPKSLKKQSSKIRGSQKSRTSKQSKESGRQRERIPINPNNFNQM